MTGILADNNIGGQLTILLHVWQSPEWREASESLGLAVRTFEELELARDSSDAVVWRTCQQMQIVLLTANRNDDGPDSLEATIRDQNSLTCLPVFTLGNAKRVQYDRTYAHETAVKALEYLLDMEKYLGTGRLFVP